MVAQNSCSMIPFSFFRTRRYRKATSLPTCCFSCIISAMKLLLSHPKGQQYSVVLHVFFSWVDGVVYLHLG